jgi:hypothetical protein
MGLDVVDFAILDADADGIEDVALACWAEDAFAIARGLGNGTFDLAATFPIGDYPARVAVGDLNGDGDPDAVVSCKAANVKFRSEGSHLISRDRWPANG